MQPEVKSTTSRAKVEASIFLFMDPQSLYEQQNSAVLLAFGKAVIFLKCLLYFPDIYVSADRLGK